jgi:urease accessory protein
MAAYVAAVLIGLGAIALAYVPRFAQESLLAATAVTGLMLALARPWPVAGGMALAAASGLALALDSPPEAITLHEANLALAGTAAAAAAALWALAWLSARLHRHWQRTGARILGSWIAASAILVLALRLVH